MKLQDAFAQALLDPEQACPPGLQTCNGSDPALRFAVHRNNVLSSLVQALADGYPVVCQLVGEPFFRAMAQCYVQQTPPTHAVLVHYGASFAEFIEGFAPASSVPYLAAVARLERARVQVYHAADAVPLAVEYLAAVLADPSQLAGLRLQLQPASQVLSSPYASVSLWLAHQGSLELGGVDPYQTEHALVVRQALGVQVLVIGSGQACFIQGLQDGVTLEEAALMAFAAEPAFDLSKSLALLIKLGLICGLE